MVFRRNFRRVLMFAVVAPTLATDCALAAYPDRIIRIIVPFAPGGGTDVVARTLAQEMAKELGVSVIVENKPGSRAMSFSRRRRQSTEDSVERNAKCKQPSVAPRRTVELE